MVILRQPILNLALRIETELEATFVLVLVLVLATERAAHIMIRTLMTMGSLFLATDPNPATVLTLATILDRAPALLHRSCSLAEATPRCRAVHTPHQDMLVQSLGSLPVFQRDHTHPMAVGLCQCQFTERHIPHQPYPCLA